MGILYPSFLYALAAIAIPVILHLAQLRKAKRVEFSNVKFIKASKDITASQRNLKELLILLCRILFVIFLVLAFAQPFIPASESFVPADTSQVGIMVDNSYSMQNTREKENEPLLSGAVGQAQTIIDLFPASATFKISTASGAGTAAMVEGNATNSFLQGINFSSNKKLQLSAGNTAAEQLFIISDFQKSTFQPQALAALDSNRQVHLVPLKGAGTANITIDSVYLDDEFIRPAGDNVLHIRLYNAGDETVEDCAVKLVVNDNQLASLSLDLPPRQITETSLNFSLLSKGISNAYVLVEDYPVEFDNTYYFVMAPSRNIDIVEISDAASSALQRLYRNEAFFRPQLYQPGNLDYARASSSNIIILNSVSNISSGVASTLAGFVKGGGTLVIIPSGQADNASYSGLFQNLSIPANITATAGEGAKTALAVPDPNSPFFKSIFSNYDPKMQMPAATRKLVWSRAADDILKFRGGTPFLSRFERGNGQVYLMASPLEDAYNDLQNHALFVPVMYKMAISSYKQEQQLAYTLDENTTVTIPVTTPARREGIYKLVQDSLEYIPEQQVRGGRLLFTVPPTIDKAGFYDLRLNDSTLTTIAFNFDKEESLLEQYSPEELRSFVPENLKNVHVYKYGDAFSVKGEFEKRFFGVKLWKYCLILCLIFLLAEIALIRFL